MKLSLKSDPSSRSLEITTVMPVTEGLLSTVEIAAEFLLLHLTLLSPTVLPQNSSKSRQTPD